MLQNKKLNREKSLVSSSSEKKLMKNLSTSSGFSYFSPRETLTMINWKSFFFSYSVFWKILFLQAECEEWEAHNYEASLSWPRKKQEEKLENWKEKLFHNSFASHFQRSQKKEMKTEKLNLGKCFFLLFRFGVVFSNFMIVFSFADNEQNLTYKLELTHFLPLECI